MIWVIIAILIIALFIGMGYVRGIYTKLPQPSDKFRRRIAQIINNPHHIALKLLKDELNRAKFVEKLYIYYYIAEIYYEQGRYMKSVRLLRSILVSPYIHNLNELYEKVVILLGRNYLKLNMFNEGIDFLKEHKLKSNKEYYILLSKLYESVGDFTNALNYYKKVLPFADKESVVNYLSKLSIESSRRGKLETAEKLLIEASRIHENEFVKSAKGILHFYKGNLDEAKEIFKNVLKIAPNLYSYIKEEFRDAFYETDSFDEFMEFLKDIENPIAKLDYMKTLVNMGMTENVKGFLMENYEAFFNSIGLTAMLYELIKDDEVLNKLLKLALEEPIYKCTNCGYESNVYHVECPNCFKIGSFSVK